jgi:signal transduction histidine kinase
MTSVARAVWRWRVWGGVAAGMALWLLGCLWALQVFGSYRDAQLHSQVSALGGSAATALGNALNQRLALVRGLAAFVSVKVAVHQGGHDHDLQAEFPPFAAALYGSMPGIRNVSVAPDFIVGHVYPMDPGNQRVLGNNLLADRRPGFADAVRRSIDSHGLTVHDPVELIQGNLGLIARDAVFVGDKPWGAVGVAFEIMPLLAASGLPDIKGVAWGVRTNTALRVGGDIAVFAQAPVVVRVNLPEGYWELGLAPQGGWEHAEFDGVEYRLLQGGMAGLGVLVLLLTASLSYHRRQLEQLVQARTVALVATQHDLQQRAQELGRANAQLERFAYVAAHDLQEPLRAITAFSQLVARTYPDLLDDEGRTWLAEVVSAAARMRLLLRDIQLYLAENKLPLPTAPLPAGTALQKALDGLSERIRDCRAVVKVDPLPLVMADQRRLAETLTVLLSNALEYRSPDRPPDIRVGARRVGEFHVIDVVDNGIGIDGEYLLRIFEVFQRLHSRAEHPGTGMGLAIARKMIERLGGHIAVVSEPGRGSTFSIFLPVPKDGPQ